LTGSLLALEHRYLDHFVAVAQFVHMLHAGDHLPEYGMHPGQMGLGAITNVKLGAARVGTPVGHGHGAPHVPVGVDFTLDGIAGPAGAVPSGAAALGDKP